MKKLFFLLSLCFTLLIPHLLFAENEKPFVIPALQEWKGGTGECAISKHSHIVIDKQFANELSQMAHTFAQDMEVMFGFKPKVSKASKSGKGDIFFTLSTSLPNGNETYQLEIREGVRVIGATPQAAFWATRTLLQLMDQTEGTTKQLPQGETIDYPNYPQRGFMLDVGRKFFTIDFLRDYVKFMSYYKMNLFQVHLNDNSFKQFFNNDWAQTPSGFRLESETYPGLASKDGHYTKKEFIDFQILAEEYHVEILPEIDAPAHTLAFTHFMPEIGSKEYGMDHLDLFNPKTYQFLDGLFKEYLEGESPVFRGKGVHIGTDEYSNKDKKVVEKFRYFTDYYIKYVEKFGKKPYLWGALTHAKGETPVQVKNVTMGMWYNGYANPQEMKALGYDMISVPDGWLYIVPNAGYYYDYLNIKNLYDNWEPNMIGNQTFDRKDPQIKGGMFAVWNDHAFNGITFKDVHHRVFPAMQTLSAKMWTGKENSPSWEVFDAQRAHVAEAPGVNLLGRVKSNNGTVLNIKKAKPGTTTGVTEVGFGYRVTFDLLIRSTKPGTVLFESPNAKVYLSDLLNGKLGFSCDKYYNTFDYTVPINQKVNIAIEGTNKETRLFVNGKLHQTLERELLQFGKDKMYYIQTLVFPLQTIGKFDGEMNNLEVTIK